MKEVLETLLVEAEGRPYAALTEVTAHRDRLRNDVYRLTSGRSVLSFELKTTCRSLRAIRVEIGTVNGQLTAQKRLKVEAEQKMTDVPYELNDN